MGELYPKAFAYLGIVALQDKVLLGVDTGGTFTDFVMYSAGSVRVHKVLSTPEDPSLAILQGIKDLGIDLDNSQLYIAHGSTVATNAALEGKGVRTAYITNAGLEDVLTIGRQSRSELYNLSPAPKPEPVASELCFGVDVRLSSEGKAVAKLTDEKLVALCKQVAGAKPKAVAINLLFSFLEPSDEKLIEGALRDSFADGEIFISRSSEVLSTLGEYERGMATWLNAWLGPVVERYLKNLSTALGDSKVSVMQSSGGMIDARSAANKAVRLLLSGPAGGLAAAKSRGAEIGRTRLLTFDMGGTSSDVALIDSDIQLTTEGQIADYPVSVPMVDMHTIGAGGGSIAWIDEGGAIKVGPESAGAFPGPACYGLGGARPTVTDANAVLGKLQARSFVSGDLNFDLEAARRAFEPLAGELGLSVEAVAEGVLRIANENMRQALQLISVQKGYDPREFTLCCFGGAGGLHVCELAESMSIKQVLIPRFGGVFSALGMLLAPKERQLSRSFIRLVESVSESDLESVFRQLEDEGARQLTSEGAINSTITFQRFVDCRYRGQSFTLSIPWLDLESIDVQFSKAHKQRYGHALEIPVEIVNLRVSATSPSETLRLEPVEKSEKTEEIGKPIYWADIRNIETPVPVYQREELFAGWQLNGPVVIAEQTSTTFVDTDWQVEIDALGNLLMRRD